MARHTIQFHYDRSGATPLPQFPSQPVAEPFPGASGPNPPPLLPLDSSASSATPAGPLNAQADSAGTSPETGGPPIPKGPKPDTVRSQDSVGTLDGEALTPEVIRRVTQMWEDAAGEDSAQPGHTLKGATTSEVKETHLVIQPRVLRRPADTPAESLTISADYELLEVIGVGGVGIVYSARQSSIDRNVAVKMIKAERAADLGQRDKFLAEAVVTGDLDHPNIVPIYDLGSDASGSLFYSMKHVQGTPWSKVVEKKPLSENLEILMRVADAIAFAHARGVVHRDIKPENVMLGEFGEVLVMDWGIALPTTSYRKTGEVLRGQGLGGTPAYMSPEMVTGPVEKISAAADVYLLGAVLYEIVTGQPPHQGRNVMACVMAAAKNEITPTERSGELVDIAHRAMATLPKDRYGSVAEFQAAIREYESHLESTSLAERADEDLRNAERTESYDDYARAVFAYQESLAMWDGNVAAGAGVPKAKLAYATCAYKKGDYDLGLSLLDGADPNHAPMRANLLAALRERDARQARLRHVRQLVAGLLVLIFLGGAGAFAVIYNFYKIAQVNEKKAEEKKKEADEKKAEAVQERGRAVNEARRADRERRNAEASRADAMAARSQVEERSYFAEMAVVEQLVGDNAFDVARQMLDGQARDPKGRFRHWEWQRQQYLCRTDSNDPAVRSILTSENYIEAVALSSTTPRQIAVGDVTGKVQLFSWPEGARPNNRAWHTFEAWAHLPGANRSDEATITALEFSADGKFLAVAGGDGTAGRIAVWEIAGEQVRLHRDLPRSVGQVVTCLRWSADGQLILFGANDWSVRAWHLDSDRPLELAGIHLDVVHNVDVAPDGRRVLSSSRDGTVRVWRLGETNIEQLTRFRGHRGAVRAARFTPDGKRIASGGYDRKVLIWNAPAVDAQEMPVEQSLRQRVTELQRELASGTAPPRATAVEPAPAGDAGATIVASFNQHTASVRSLAFDADGGRLLTGGEDNVACVWDVARGQLIKKLRGHGGWIASVAISADGRSAVTGGFDRSCRWWDIENYEEIRWFGAERTTATATATMPRGMRGVPLQIGRPIRATRFAPDGKWIATALDDGRVLLFDFNTGAPVAQLNQGHQYLVSTGLFFPDGRHVLTAAGDNTLRIWDVEAGVERLRIDGTGGRAVAALSPDGRYLLTGSNTKEAKWWRLPAELISTSEVAIREGAVTKPLGQAELLNTLNPYGAAVEEILQRAPTMSRERLRRDSPDVTAAAVSPDGHLLITGDAFGRCWIWEAATGKLLRELSGHTAAITTIAVLPSTSGGPGAMPEVLTAGADGAIVHWDVSSGKEVDRKIQPDRAAVASLAVSADGRYAATVSPYKDTTPRGERKAGGVAGQVIPSRMWWWKLRPLESLAEVALDEGPLADYSAQSVTFAGSAADELVVAMTQRRNARQELWTWRPKLKKLEELKLVTARAGAAWNAVFSSDNRQLLTVGGNTGHLWDLQRGALVADLRSTAAIHGLDISPDGRWLVTASKDGAALLWDVATRRPERNLAGVQNRPLHGVAFSPDSRFVGAVGDGGTAFVWRVEDGVPIGNWSALESRSWRVVRFSPDGRWLVLASAHGETHLYDWRQLSMGDANAAQPTAVVREFTHPRGIRAAMFSADSRWLITGSDDNNAYVWDVATGRQLSVLGGHFAPVNSVAFSRDGQRALTASDDNSIRLWNVAALKRGGKSSESVATLERHERGVTAAEFSPDGKHLLTADEDGVAMLWLGNELEPSLDISFQSQIYLPWNAPTAATRPWLPVTKDPVVSFPCRDGASTDETRPPLKLVVTIEDMLGGALNGVAPSADSEVASDTSKTDEDDTGDELDVRAEFLKPDSASSDLDAYEVRESELWTRDATPQRIARWQGGRRGEPLEIEMRRGVTPEELLLILRSVGYRNVAESPNLTTRSIVFRLRRGEQFLGVAEGGKTSIEWAERPVKEEESSESGS